MDTTTTPAARTLTERLAAVIGRPYRRSIVQRQEAAINGQRMLTRYRDSLRAPSLLDPGAATPRGEASTQRVQTLLWAQAYVEQALALETGNRLGHDATTASAVLKRYENALGL